MQKNNNAHKIDWIHSLKDAFLAGLLALLIFIPIRGMIIDSWELKFQFFYPLLFSAIIFSGRLLLNISYQINFIANILKKIFRQKILEVVVEREEKTHINTILIGYLFYYSFNFSLCSF